MVVAVWRGEWGEWSSGELEIKVNILFTDIILKYIIEGYYNGDLK